MKVVKVFFNRFFLSLKFYKLYHGVQGIRSDIKNMHVFYMDLDSVNSIWLKERLKKMQERFRMSDIHVFPTNNIGGFHVYCCDLFNTKGEIIDILSWFDQEMTKKFQIFSCHRNYFVLRFSPKLNRTTPIYWYSLNSNNGFRKQSTALHNFLRGYYSIKLRPLKRPDNYKILHYDVYPVVYKDDDIERFTGGR